MDLAHNTAPKDEVLQLLPQSVHILKQTPMLRALHTVKAMNGYYEDRLLIMQSGDS